jgi:hypothetical protein
LEHPVLGVSSDGLVHVFWAEREVSDTGGPPPATQTPVSLRSIWYSRYAAGRWTKPQLILKELAGTWTPSNVSKVVSVDGTVQFVMTSKGDSTRAFVRVVADSSGARVLQIPGASPMGLPSTSFAALENFRSAVFVRTVVSRESAGLVRHREVVQLRSDDSGRSWKEPLVIYRSEGRVFQDVDIAFAGDRSLHLLALAVDSGKSVVSHLRSTEFGRTWVEGAQLTRVGHLQYGDILIGPCSELFAHYEDWTGAMPVPVFFKFDSLSAREVSLGLTEPGEHTAMLSLVGDSRGNQRLAWTTIRVVDGVPSAPRTRTASIEFEKDRASCAAGK